MTRIPYDRKEDASGLRLVAHTDLNGHGDCMHVARKDHYIYVGHMGESRVGTSIVDVSDPSNPRVVNQIPAESGSHSHKVQIVGDLMVVNHERDPKLAASRWTAGIGILDISHPAAPRQVGFFPVAGGGVHRMTYWEKPYAYLAASVEGYDQQILLIADLSDPSNPREMGRWWFPGQWTAGGETPTWEKGRRVNLHHALVAGDRAYCGIWDLGMVILDIEDRGKPRLVSHLDFGASVSGDTHTTCPLPGTSVLVTTDECTTNDWQKEPRRRGRLVDISDETNPRVISLLPEPEGDFDVRGLRFGTHNVHEMEPGSLVDPNTVYVTYFNAGLRVYDVRDVRQPREIAYYIPETPPNQKAPQINGVYVDPNGLIYVTDRYTGGLYILERA